MKDAIRHQSRNLERILQTKNTTMMNMISIEIIL
jgi:hypothetical protein